MPIVSENQNLNAWVKWQEHLEKRFKKKEQAGKVQEQEPKETQEAQEQKPEDKQEQELNLEFLEKPIE